MSSNYIDAAVTGGDKLVFAHRGNHEQGSSHKVENTIEALERADADGVSDAMEVDFRKLGDGTIVAYHDAALGDGPLKGQRLSSLSLADLAAYPEIPTLDEFARAAAPLDIGIMAEIKETGSEREIIDGLRAHLPAERLSAMSFKADAVRAIDEAYPDVPVGFLPRKGAFLLGSASDQVRALGFTPDFVEASGGLVSSTLLDDLGRMGVPLIAGGTGSDAKVQLLDDPRVLGLMVNEPSAVPELEAATYDPDEHGTIGADDSGVTVYDIVPDRFVDETRAGVDEAIDAGEAALNSAKELGHEALDTARSVQDRLPFVD